MFQFKDLQYFIFRLTHMQGAKLHSPMYPNYFDDQVSTDQVGIQLYF